MTRRFAVLGSPVAHSLSPSIHNAAFDALGIDAVYEARDVDTDGMRRQAAEAKAGTLSGANITMPHKAAAAALCDDLSTTAIETGSVNTWVPREGDLVGHSTDGEGVRYAWERADLPVGDVVILGSGGAAIAAAHHLRDTMSVWISARREEAATAVSARLGVETLAWGETRSGAVVVNATPVGMGGEAIDPSLLDGAVGYFEMVYASGATPTEELARARGLPVARGVDMLLGQAMASFELWFGVPAPENAMRGALNDSSSKSPTPKPA